MSCSCIASCKQYVDSTYCFCHIQKEQTMLLAARQSSNCMPASLCNKQAYHTSPINQEKVWRMPHPSQFCISHTYAVGLIT